MDTTDRPDHVDRADDAPGSTTAPGAPERVSPAPTSPSPGSTAPGPTGSAVDGRQRSRLVTDPTLAARFTRERPPPRGRRFVATYPGAVVAAACLVALAVVVGIRALSTDGSPAAASVGPPAAVTTTGAPTAPVPPATSTTVTGASPGSPTTEGPTPGGPLTSPVRSSAAAPTGLQAVAGAALVRNPGLRLAVGARRQLLAGVVDVRLSTVLATVAAQAALTVDSFQSVRSDPAGSPVRQATVSATDPSDRDAVTRALSDQAGDYAVATGPTAADGLRTVRLRTGPPR